MSIAVIVDFKEEFYCLDSAVYSSSNQFSIDRQQVLKHAEKYYTEHLSKKFGVRKINYNPVVDDDRGGFVWFILSHSPVA